MSEFILTQTGEDFREHHNYPYGENVSSFFSEPPLPIVFPKKPSEKCVEFITVNKQIFIHTSYYIGVDHIGTTGKTIYIQPKLNEASRQTDYLQMLFSALRHPEISNYTDELFDIKCDEPQIEIKQQQDLLTPLLVVQFLKVVQEIVRKGLKKSYYKVEQNLNSRVKGKILVGKTIKHNLLKNKTLKTYCSFNEFGINNLENRLLKKALVFIQRYLPTLNIQHSQKYLQNIFGYIMPAFEFVSEEVNLHDVKHAKYNAFYKEYVQGIHLARLILQRFGYNISNTQQTKISTPPFWIDMSKLFELYVLGLLKDRFASYIQYHYTKQGNELDYLLNNPEYKMVIDAKYKEIYRSSYDMDNIRQLSGYARIKSVVNELGFNENEVVDCLIIYPDQIQGNFDLLDLDLKDQEFGQFVKFYKVGVKLPIIEESNTN